MVHSENLLNHSVAPSVRSSFHQCTLICPRNSIFKYALHLTVFNGASTESSVAAMQPKRENLKHKNRLKSNVIHHMWRNLHRGNKKKLHSTKGRKQEQVSQLRTSTSPFKTPNPRMHMEHCVHRENHLSEEHNGRPANCLQETKPKQTSAFFHCETGGPFLESPGNLTGPKLYLEIKVSRKVGCVQSSNEVHFVSLADYFTV